MVYAMLRPFLLASAATISTTAPMVFLRHTCGRTLAVDKAAITRRHRLPLQWLIQAETDISH